MSDKTVLITGANKSIGYETARRMGALGYGIWLGCRDLARGEAAARKLRDAGSQVRVIEIEVTDEDSIKAAAARVSAEDGRLRRWRRAVVNICVACRRLHRLHTHFSAAGSDSTWSAKRQPQTLRP